MPDSPWTSDHRDVLLRRITALTAGTAVVGAVGAVGLGALFGTQTVAAKSTQAVVVRQAAPTTARATTTDESVSPTQVQVRVLNGTGVAGAARAAAGDLTAQGFTVVGVGNAPGGTVSATTISYAAGELGAARTLARLTGVSALVADGSGSVVVLTVGPDWTGSAPAPQRVRSQPSNGGSSNGGSSNGGSSNGGSSNSGSSNGGSSNSGPVSVSGGS